MVVWASDGDIICEFMSVWQSTKLPFPKLKTNVSLPSLLLPFVSIGSLSSHVDLHSAFASALQLDDASAVQLAVHSRASSTCSWQCGHSIVGGSSRVHLPLFQEHERLLLHSRLLVKRSQPWV